MTDGFEPIDDDEIILRRIPISQNWYDSAVSPSPSHLAFRPQERDVTGISFSRLKYVSLFEASRGPSKKGYYLAQLRVGDLRKAGIEISPDDPLSPNAVRGHAEIRALRAETRDGLEALEITRKLAAHCIEVAGPFAQGPAI